MAPGRNSHGYHLLGNRIFSPQQPQVEHDQYQGNQCDDDCQSQPVTQVQELEDLCVGKPADQGGGIARAATGQHVDDVEGQDGGHRLIDQDDQENWAQQRQGDHSAEGRQPPPPSIFAASYNSVRD